MKYKLLIVTNILSLAFAVFSISRQTNATYYMTPGGFYGTYPDSYTANPLNEWFLIEGTPNNPGRIYSPSGQPTVRTTPQPTQPQTVYQQPAQMQAPPPATYYCPPANTSYDPRSMNGYNYTTGNYWWEQYYPHTYSYYPTTPIYYR
jgi:hypothetical protein